MKQDSTWVLTLKSLLSKFYLSDDDNKYQSLFTKTFLGFISYSRMLYACELHPLATILEIGAQAEKWENKLTISYRLGQI